KQQHQALASRAVETARCQERIDRELDSSSRTVPAQGQGWPATGDQEGEGREICEGAASVLFSGTVRGWFLLVSGLLEAVAAPWPAGKVTGQPLAGCVKD